MIVVTGGAGMIGSNIAKALSEQGERVFVVDDLSGGDKFKNLIDFNFEEYIDKDNFIDWIKSTDILKNFKAVIHNGAISSTTAKDAKKVMESNYEYSKTLISRCQKYNCRLIYASSASVYGNNQDTLELRKNENPLNLYAFSKMLIDRIVVDQQYKNIVGLRYFNVYGPNEFHKVGQSSPVLRYYNEVKSGKLPEVYSGDDGLGNDAVNYSRDFIHVEDVVKVVLWFLNNDLDGIYNVGTGVSNKFEYIAKLVQKWFCEKNIDHDPRVIKVPMPDHIKGGSQPFTRANISKLKKAGYSDRFLTIEEGVKKYLDWLDKK